MKHLLALLLEWLCKPQITNLPNNKEWYKWEVDVQTTGAICIAMNVVATDAHDALAQMYLICQRTGQVPWRVLHCKPVGKLSRDEAATATQAESLDEYALRRYGHYISAEQTVRRVLP